MNALRRGAVFGFLALFVQGCSSTPSESCGPPSCPTGCCDSTGQCVTGFASSACGANGSACSECSASQHCVAGFCVTPGTDAGEDSGITAADAGSCDDDPCIAHQTPLPSNCGTCQANVCALDPACCTNIWDVGCVARAQAVCVECVGGKDAGEDAGEDAGTGDAGSELDGGMDAGADAGEDGGEDGGTDAGSGADAGTLDAGLCGDPCVTHASPMNALCSTCQALVCARDRTCCNTAWDIDCVDDAKVYCAQCIPDGGALIPVCNFIGDPCTGNNDCCTATCSGNACVSNPDGGQVSCGPVTDLCVAYDAGVYPSSPTCDPCVAMVCGDDPFCCNIDSDGGGYWDVLCVEDGADFLCERCDGGP